MPSRDEANLRHAKHYKSLLRAADKLYKKGGENILTALRQFDLEWANIQTGQAWTAIHAEQNSSAEKLCNIYPGAGAYLLNLRLPPAQRISWIEPALMSARRLHDREAECAHLARLSTCYSNIGALRRANEYDEQALSIAREIGNRKLEGQILTNLGLDSMYLGVLRRANEYNEQALALPVRSATVVMRG